jgi:hypothetical protein
MADRTPRTPKKERDRLQAERAQREADDRAAKQARFLLAFRDTGNVRASCQAAGIGRQTAYDWRDQYPPFAAQWDEAQEDAVDVLEAVALQRAKATSDTLLIFLLKAHRPDKYRDTVNLRLFVEREAAAMAEQTGISAPDIMAEFNTLIGATR